MLRRLRSLGVDSGSNAPPDHSSTRHKAAESSSLSAKQFHHEGLQAVIYPSRLHRPSQRHPVPPPFLSLPPCCAPHQMCSISPVPKSSGSPDGSSTISQILLARSSSSPTPITRLAGTPQRYAFRLTPVPPFMTGRLGADSPVPQRDRLYRLLQYPKGRKHHHRPEEGNGEIPDIHPPRPGRQGQLPVRRSGFPRVSSSITLPPGAYRWAFGFRAEKELHAIYNSGYVVPSIRTIHGSRPLPDALSPLG